jgi:hypothetical protein
MAVGDGVELSWKNRDPAPIGGHAG